jgi:hypothetical protein
VTLALNAGERSGVAGAHPPCAREVRLDVMIGRRDATRHPVGIAARFLAHEVNVRVQLEDISASGACIRLLHPRALAAGRLCWLDFEIFGQVVWQRDERCGLKFDERLTPDCLRRTLEFADRAARDTDDRYRRLASAWVHGLGDY